MTKSTPDPANPISIRLTQRERKMVAELTRAQPERSATASAVIRAAVQQMYDRFKRAQSR